MATLISARQWRSVIRCRERSLSWMPDFGNEASPPGLDGTRQYRSSNGGGLWRATLTAVQLRTREQVLAWFATEVLLKGGMEPIDVPLLLDRYQPQLEAGTSIAVRAIMGGWPARAVTGRVTTEGTTTLEAGQHFSVYDATTYGWRLHRIAVVAATEFPERFDLTFWPPTRFVVADDQPLEIDDPHCVMRLASSDAMDLDLERRVRGEPSVSFVEAY